MKEPITWEHFSALDIRVGTVVKAIQHPTAKKPAFILEIDFGPEIGVLKSSAQITDLYTVDGLIAQQVIAVINFPRKQIGPIMSQCLVLGAYNAENQVVLLKPDTSVKNGSLIG